MSLRRYVQESRKYAGSHGAVGNLPRTLGPAGKPTVVYPVVPLRDLDIANAGTMLARFNLIMRQAERSTLVGEMATWRQNGFDGIQLVNFIRRPGDPVPRTRADYIKFLCDGSPILRAIFWEVFTHVLLKEEKLLITENVPLIAWYWEIALQLLLVGAKVLHAGLNQSTRHQLGAAFNKRGSPLKVLVIMYNVSGQGINLHHACSRVFVATPAINLARQLQAISRAIRVRN